MVFNRQGEAMGILRLHERSANRCLGGPKHSHLDRTTCHWVEALDAEAHGAL